MRWSQSSTHPTSSANISRFGWLMSLAFLLSGSGFPSSLRSGKARDSYKSGRFWNLGFAYHRRRLFLRRIFPPDPKRFVGSLLHGIGGLAVIFGSPMVFTLVCNGFVRNEASATAPRPLICTATFTCLSLFLFYGSFIAFCGEPHPGSIIVGWTNRILITTFVLWLLVAASHVRSRSR